MTLPCDIAYDCPADPLPRSRADWSLDPRRAALLVHDLQRYFAQPYAERCLAFVQAVDATARLLEAARGAGVPVFYTAQTGDQDPGERGLQGDLWGPGMRATPEHTGILEQVAPRADDVVLVKHRYSAFARSDLAERLAQAGRSQLVITGVYAHIGVLATSLEAFQREIQPFVVADAVADLGEQEHRRALELIASCSGVVNRTDDVLAAFESNAASNGVDAHLRAALDGLLPAEVVEGFFTRPDDNWFELGLDSLRAFDFLDQLAGDGLDIDYGEFVRTPSLTWLREQAAEAGRRSGVV